MLMKVVEVKNESVEGKDRSSISPFGDQTKSWTEEYNQKLSEHERKLQEHMVYHLTANHRLPSLNVILHMQFKNLIKL